MSSLSCESAPDRDRRRSISDSTMIDYTFGLGRSRRHLIVRRRWLARLLANIRFTHAIAYASLRALSLTGASLLANARASVLKSMFAYYLLYIWYSAIYMCNVHMRSLDVRRSRDSLAVCSPCAHIQNESKGANVTCAGFMMECARMLYIHICIPIETYESLRS